MAEEMSPRPPGYFRGQVNVVRCPRCSWAFLTHEWTKRTRCRYCGLVFKLTIKPKARRFKHPRTRILRTFDSLQEAREFLAKWNKAALDLKQ